MGCVLGFPTNVAPREKMANMAWGRNASVPMFEGLDSAVLYQTYPWNQQELLVVRPAKSGSWPTV